MEFGVGFRRQFDDKLSLTGRLTVKNEFLEYSFQILLCFSKKRRAKTGKGVELGKLTNGLFT